MRSLSIKVTHKDTSGAGGFKSALDKMGIFAIHQHLWLIFFIAELGELKIERDDAV
jgi:hypothetical protein